MSNSLIVRGFDDESCDYLKIRLHRLEQARLGVLVEMSGSIDTANASQVRRRLLKVVEAGFRQLILGIRQLEYISSMGIGVILSLNRLLTDQGGTLMLLDPHPKVESVLHLMKLDTMFSCSDSIGEAVAKILGSPTQPVFPRRIHCPICDKPLRVEKSGRFRCPECKSPLTVDATGRACLG